MRKSVSIYDIAKIAGVSASTVSKAVNGTGTIAAKTREHILDIARREGYVASYAARSLNERNTHTIGIITPDVSNPFYSAIIRRVETLLSDEGYTCFICDTNSDPKRTERHLQGLVQRQVDGLVCVNGHLGDGAGIIPDKLPLLLLDPIWKTDRTWTVWVGNDLSSIVQDNVCVLAKRGCRHIGVVSIFSTYSFSGIPFGLTDTMSELGLTVDENLMLRGNHLKESRIEAAELVGACLDRGHVIDGLVCLGDRIALGACEALRERGLSIGHDVRVIGMDDSLFARVAVPAISSVDRHVDEMCERGVEALLSMIAGIEPAEPHIVIGHEVVERESTLGT